ncbi:uncharacterized protein LOC134861083 [Eleginops maclovinus]|uniref:uncharacterized protein LOC134861083 n=1 Tax=Eleginops maclovinus TaxID=56733 RepID=UPI00307FF86E
MDLDREDEEDVFCDPEEPAQEEEEEEVNEEEDAQIFNAWKLQNQAGGRKEEEEQEANPLAGKPESRLETTVRPISGRRSSLPCQATLSPCSCPASTPPPKPL